MSTLPPPAGPTSLRTPGGAPVLHDDRPLVVACIRVTDLRPLVDPLTGAVRRDQRAPGLSSSDAAALELALRVAEKWSGRVVAVAAAPATAEPVLREVLAFGASVIRIDTGPEDELSYPSSLAEDERRLASWVAEALAPFGVPALVLCGDRSADRGTGAFPAYLAHQLGAAQALGLVSLVPETDTLIGERRLDGGWRERIRIPCPAVCSVEGVGLRLRRASLNASLDAARQAVPVVIARDDAKAVGATSGPFVATETALPFRPRTRVLPPPLDADPRLRLLALTGVLTDHDPPVVIGPVDASSAADTLIAFLDRHGYLGAPPQPATTVTDSTEHRK